MDAFDLDSLMTDVTDPRALAAALRRKEAAIPALRQRENLGEIGMLGGADLAPAAQAMMQGARQQIGDANEGRQMVLKRALWQQQRKAEAPPSDGLLAEAERVLGMPRERAALYSAGGLRSMLTGEVHRGRAREAAFEDYNRPEKSRERDLERRVKEATLAEKSATIANRPGANESELRKEWTSQAPYKNAQAAIEQYAKVENASPDAAGDLSLIFSYMKMLDPGSAVREGEFANAQNAAGIPDRIVAAYNKAQSGERLSPDARQRFRKEAEAVLGSTLDAYESQAEFWRGVAKDRGFRVENVVPPMARLRKKDARPAGAASPAPATAAGSVRVRWKGKIKEIPAERVEEALGLGAERVE